MANLTVGQVLLQVDALLPNQYTAEEKRRWLKQAEGFVIEEVIKVHEGGENCRLPEFFRQAASLYAVFGARRYFRSPHAFAAPLRYILSRSAVPAAVRNTRTRKLSIAVRAWPLSPALTRKSASSRIWWSSPPSRP